MCAGLINEEKNVRNKQTRKHFENYLEFLIYIAESFEMLCLIKIAGSNTNPLSLQIWYRKGSSK